MIAGADLWANLDPASPPDWAHVLTEALRGMYPDDATRLRDHRAADYRQYRDRPVDYIRQILAVEPTPMQEEMARLLLTPPYKVIVASCNNYGKSHIAGSLTNWWYDSFDPGVCVTTAPTARDVEDVLWAEVRQQRRTRWDFRGDRAPELYDRPDHYAKGYTGMKAEAFHGRHPEHMLFILDEAVALKAFVWTGLKSMFKGGGKHHLLALLNPTDTTSPAYAEFMSGQYHTVRLSALEHPNVVAQLKGDPPPVPQAVDVGQLQEWFADPVKFEEVRADEFKPGDVLWPPPWADPYGALDRLGRAGKRVCYRPGPEGQARVLGLWPDSSPGAIWSDLAWQCAVRTMDGYPPLPLEAKAVPQVGCDVARGTATHADKTAVVVQVGGVAVEHLTGSGWDTVRTATALIELADRWARWYNEHRDPRATEFLHPEHVPLKIDDGAMGAGVVDIVKAKGYWAVPVNASTVSRDPTRYPIMRDQLWFAVPLAARQGVIDLSRLPRRVLAELRRQCMAVQWKPDIHGRRKVEKKEETKARLQRSPDDSDALNLAFFSPLASGGGAPHVFRDYQGGTAAGPPAPPPGPLYGATHAR